MHTLKTEIERIQSYKIYGRVVGIQGLLVEVAGAIRNMSIGSRVNILSRSDKIIPCEVVGFRLDRALLMPYTMLEGVGVGCKAFIDCDIAHVYPSEAWLGRVINAMGEPIDGKGPIKYGTSSYAIRNTPPPAHLRTRVKGKMDIGVRSINTFVTCCKGQRMGIFAGSGVGKSILLSMFARYTVSDVTVIGLVGERGREVQEFLEDDLGEEGLKKSVVIVATSDETALMRRQAAYLTLTVSEYFRDQGQDVLCLMDSVTRFAMAQREIGLAGGEPPATKGYTPTVFAELPKLLERAGPGTSGGGTITGLFTVLVEGDDHNEPVSDAVRGILDGHIVLDRAIAERGRFPAVNILKSVSRTMPGCNSDEENQFLSVARKYMADYNDMEEMIRLGAYRPGANREIDEAIYFHPELEGFLAQNKEEQSNLASGYELLSNILHNQPQLENFGPAGQDKE